MLLRHHRRELSSSQKNPYHFDKDLISEPLSKPSTGPSIQSLCRKIDSQLLRSIPRAHLDHSQAPRERVSLICLCGLQGEGCYPVCGKSSLQTSVMVSQGCCKGMAFTGYCIYEGSVERPVYPPISILNDFVAGYLGAAGTLAALIRRSTEGGSYVFKLSLAAPYGTPSGATWTRERLIFPASSINCWILT